MAKTVTYDRLRIAVNQLKERLEHAINETQTSDERNVLTDANIRLTQAEYRIAKAEEMKNG